MLVMKFPWLCLMSLRENLTPRVSAEELLDVIKDHRPSIIPFRYFKHLTSDEIMSILSGEHNQLIALILSLS